MFYLSQAHLERFQRCPPDFQAVYLEQLVAPSDPSSLENQQWGTKFHQAMQQLQLGLPLEHVTTEPKLRQALTALLQAEPQLLHPPHQQTAAEYRRTLTIGNFLLTIICDWIAFGENTLQIYDWKTYRQPKHSSYLKNHWQTKLYLYVMAATTNYLPEQLTMTYWFVAPEERPQSLTFSYDQAWHQQIENELTETLQQLQKDLDQYFQQGTALRHPNQQSCPFCPLHQQPKNSAFADFLGDQSLEDFLGGIEAVQL
ncbi:PD-(D/E)XK nuclease family protein [Picosynechococcus sp. NKBG15041c]|uniref:PD-(D/E)XK nuclease family protein n=1 Tax=Picosynechococcus sp. NKBG15041c TaxID=1407650 RepID=UPI000422A2AB|nr:PD-(D/E)XK nuclease family protein [Picosynechococcus sp. NKBG15041c]